MNTKCSSVEDIEEAVINNLHSCISGEIRAINAMDEAQNESQNELQNIIRKKKEWVFGEGCGGEVYLEDRTPTICMRENKINTESTPPKYPLKFRMYIDDKAPPLPVSVMKEGDNYVWNSSLSPDVKEYLIYEAKEGFPFDFANPSATIGADFSNKELKYPFKSGIKITVRARDVAGNVARE